MARFHERFAQVGAARALAFFFFFLNATRRAQARAQSRAVVFDLRRLDSLASGDGDQAATVDAAHIDRWWRDDAQVAEALRESLVVGRLRCLLVACVVVDGRTLRPTR